MLTCLATLPAILFAFYIANNERAAAVARMEEDASHLVSLVSREHFYHFAGAKDLLRWIADRLATENNAANFLSSELLPALLAGYPQLANIAVLKPDGDVIKSAYPLPGSLNMHEYLAIQRALSSTDIETGVYVIGPIVKRPILQLAYAVRAADGAARQVVFVAIDLAWLGRLTAQVDLPENHVLAIVDRDGRVLASSSRPSNTTTSEGDLVPELSEVNRGQSALVQALTGETTRTFAIAPMEGFPGIVIASGLPYGQINRSANGVFYRMVGLLAFLTLFTILLVILSEELVLIRHLRSLSRSLQHFGQGDFSTRIAVPLGKGELQEMMRMFNSMADGLSSRHLELQEANTRLDAVNRHLQIVREEESQRIARDLHDEAGQVLTSLKIDLSGLKTKCFRCRTLRPQEGGLDVDGEIAGMMVKIDEMVSFIRRLASELRPPLLDSIGLFAALMRLAREIEASSELAVEVEISELEPPADWLVSTTLYRITQEALTNVVRHAHASLVRVDLREEGQEILLSIQDNGTGIPSDAGRTNSLGILGMRERALLVGGSFFMETPRDGKGTVVIVRIPTRKGKEEAGENSARR